jgi:hypothetical protein
MNRILTLALALLLSLSTSLAGADLASGLVGQWRFDDCDGKTVKDFSGRGNDGAIAFGTIRGGEKIGTGTFATNDFPGFSPFPLGASPIFSQLLPVLHTFNRFVRRFVLRIGIERMALWLAGYRRTA